MESVDSSIACQQHFLVHTAKDPVVANVANVVTLANNIADDLRPIFGITATWKATRSEKISLLSFTYVFHVVEDGFVGQPIANQGQGNTASFRGGPGYRQGYRPSNLALRSAFAENILLYVRQRRVLGLVI